MSLLEAKLAHKGEHFMQAKRLIGVVVLSLGLTLALLALLHQTEVTPMTAPVPSIAARRPSAQ